ncbi:MULTISPECIES: LysR family transcriptional regulator [Pseudomonas]|uniref:LysR family transcriptional regulator n=1 Tax=Pseudomonas TaxID=286 RepID=UPI00081194EC|nr:MULTISPECIES: LysR family transcriptional regulator [Pseudomonas]ATR83280.1 LysR family transcriptional regulator [Pseudomonas sp. HLS-6]
MSVSHAQLKAFHAVALHGSFTRAAERLFLTQPAISDQVRKLEERFGILLFHRNKRSVQLTDLGERLLGITQRLFACEDEAHELLQDSRALQTGTLVLAVDAPVHVLPQIARFCQRYPGISVKIETGNTDESLLRLFNYQADLALLGRDVDDQRLLCVPLRDDPMVAFVSHQHPWASRASISLQDLDDTPIVLREPGSVTRQTLEEEMQRAGLRIRPAIQVEGREAAREAVVVGIGVGVVSAAEFGADARVCALPIVDCQRRLTETLVCLREQSSRRLVATFLQMVQESLDENNLMTHSPRSTP